MTLHATKGLARRGARVGRGLGWLGIGLGVAQILASRRLARVLGLRDDDATRKAMVGIGWMELATGLGVVLAGRANGHRADARSGHIEEVCESITINCTPDRAYRVWRQLDNLPRFMAHLDSVELIDDRRSHWVARGPAGKTFEWDAAIIDDAPGRLISWRSLEGSGVDNSGRVEFVRAPGGRGTEVQLHMRYAAPAGRLGVMIAKLMGREPGQEALSDLRRFKQVVETGEVVHSDTSIHRGAHPARPAARGRAIKRARATNDATREVGVARAKPERSPARSEAERSEQGLRGGTPRNNEVTR